VNRSSALEAPPLRVVRKAGAPLPAPLTAFIGREKALAEVGATIRSHRLVTLIGAAGAGKTRLCIEAARAASVEFEDGVVWVELAALTDATLVPQTVASALDIRHQPGRGAGDAVAEYLRGCHRLLVLDNCEHVIEEVAELVMTVLAGAPRVHVLTTSRERLAVTGERSWRVPPLGLPPRRARDLDTLLGAEAVRLFLDRASAVRPAFAVDAAGAAAIAEICTRLDGIPLAIELAAARMNVLTPQQIADRLADAMGLLTTGARTLPKRQRTLRSALDWSYRLLDERERLLFRRLSVFAGTFSLDAAEAVCGGADFPAADVLDTLAGLVDKSLIAVRERAGEARYRMLDAVDQYATELLDEEGDADAARRRHAEYYCAIVEAQAPALRTAARARAMAVLDAEYDNIREALDWTRDTPGCTALHLRMISQLWWYWVHRVLWDEGMQRFSAAAAMPGAGADAVAYAETLYGGGVMAWISGMHLQSRTWLERCVELRREQDDAGALGMALCALAQATLDLGDRTAALELAAQGLPLARAGCNRWDLALVLTSAYGYVHHATGQYDTAEQAYLEADALWTEPADDWGRSLARNSLAVIAWRRGDVERAHSYARDALALLRSGGDRWFASRTLQLLGFIALHQSHFDRAARLLAVSAALRSEVGARLMPFEVPESRRAVDAARTALGDVAFAEAWRAGGALDFEAALDLGMEQVIELAGAVQSGSSATDVAGAGRKRGAGAKRGPDTDVPVAAPVPPVRSEQRSRIGQPAAGRTGAADAGAPEAVAALTIRALGPLEVRRDGRVLTNEDWTYARPREMLFYLLSHEDGRTKEQIGLDLWPDASPAQLRSSFHVTMHHLRRTLGRSEWIAFHEGRYRFERVAPCSYDVDEFTTLVDAALAASDAARRIELLSSAVQLYRADFLEDAGFGAWTDVPRDRLRRRYADAALQLAAVHHAEGRFIDAEAACRALLARDNLDERAHRMLMATLADAGRPADAIRHFAVLTTLFREELGIAPSAETAALAERLVAPG
jgi:predicted ATPase/DNA-binding SARP family transcriptional activator